MLSRSDRTAYAVVTLSASPMHPSCRMREPITTETSSWILVVLYQSIASRIPAEAAERRVRTQNVAVRSILGSTYRCKTSHRVARPTHGFHVRHHFTRRSHGSTREARNPFEPHPAGPRRQPSAQESLSQDAGAQGLAANKPRNRLVQNWYATFWDHLND